MMVGRHYFCGISAVGREQIGRESIHSLGSPVYRQGAAYKVDLRIDYHQHAHDLDYTLPDGGKRQEVSLPNSGGALAGSY